MSHYHREYRKARKPHQCTICRRTIRAGETYLRGSGMDGSAWTRKECAHCDVLAAWVVKCWGLDEYGEDDVHDWDPETMGELRIKVQLNRRWTRRDGTLYPIPKKIVDRMTIESGYEIKYLAGVAPGVDAP